MQRSSTVQELFADPNRWIQGHNAENERGDAVPPTNSTACRWCFVGALIKCYGDESKGFTRAISKVQSVLKERGWLPSPTGVNSVTRWNDSKTTTINEVVSVAEEAGV